MTRIDRYLLTLYFRVLILCFLSVAGLLIVVHVFSNLDEFTRFASKGGGSLIGVLADYYGPYMLWTFEQLSGLLALLALLFAIAWLNRTNELTAMLAAGVPKRRVVKPLFIASATVILFAAFTRELVIPNFQDLLDRQPQDLTGELPRVIRPTYDDRTQALIQGRHLFPIRFEIILPNLKLQGGPLNTTLNGKLTSHHAFHISSKRKVPDGLPKELAGRDGIYFLGVKHPKQIDLISGVDHPDDGAPLLQTRKDVPWIEPNCCFLGSEVEFETLRGGNAWKQFASTKELIAHLKAERVRSSLNLRVMIHQRFLRPLVDWTVILLGVPIILTRTDRNMFWVAGVCLGLVAGFTGLLFLSSGMGSSNYLLTPAMAVWLPLIIFLPWSYAKTSAALES